MPNEMIDVLPRSADLTIDKAVELYRAHHADGTMPFRAIIEDMIDRAEKTEFNNDSYYDALFLTDMMFGRATSQVRLLSGNCVSAFLETLKEPFEALLKKLSKTAGKVQIVVLNKSEEQTFLNGMVAKYPDTVEVRYGKTTGEIKHFTVCDQRMARVEEPHAQLNGSALASEIKAKVYFQNLETAKVLASMFEAVWTRLAPKVV